MNIIVLITARGGSKGIPRKNLALLAGKPLIAWTIDAALGSRQVDRILLSTDDEEIASTGRNYGAEIPFLRPPHLATDKATSFDVAAHALQWLKEQEATVPDYLLLLQPTSPLRTSADIDAAIDIAYEKNADAVVSVCRAIPHPYLAQGIKDGVLTDFIKLESKVSRRQDYPSAYAINGAIYLNRPASLISARNFRPPGTWAYVMPPERSLDVDTPWDLKIANLLLTNESR